MFKLEDGFDDVADALGDVAEEEAEEQAEEFLEDFDADNLLSHWNKKDTTQKQQVIEKRKTRPVHAGTTIRQLLTQLDSQLHNQFGDRATVLQVPFARATAILRDLGTPCLIHQPRYSILGRWTERDGLLDQLEKEGMGCISFSPLAQVMLSFDPGASVAEAEVAVAGLSIAPVAAPVVPAQLDLSFIVSSAPAGQDWAGTIISATDLFDESTVAVFADRLVRILDGLTARPTLPVGDVAWVPGEVIDGALTRSRGTDVVLPGESVVDLVSAQTARSRRGSALWFGGRGVSYAEFGARVNALARELISQGVGPNVAVGVAIDRSVELLVAIHAVVAAGGQYVPIATDAPADRVRYMLETAGVSLVLVADAESHVVSRLVADAPRTSTGRGRHSVSGEGHLLTGVERVRRDHWPTPDSRSHIRIDNAMHRPHHCCMTRAPLRWSQQHAHRHRTSTPPPAPIGMPAQSLILLAEKVLRRCLHPCARTTGNCSPPGKPAGACPRRSM